MADDRIIIEVRNVVNTSANGPKGTTNTQGNMFVKPETQKDKTTTKGSNAFSAMFLVEGIRKLGTATGNEQINKVMTGVGKIAKFGMLGARASTGDPQAIAALVIDATAEIMKKVNEQDRKIAAINNEADKAQILAGTLDITNCTQKTNWWSGRKTYGAK